MGGHDAGSFASSCVVDHLGGLSAGAKLPAMIEEARGALGRSNAQLVALAEPGRTIGATVVALTADSRNFSCLWAGDCRAYRVRNGAITQLTRDHSLVQALIDAGELDAFEAENHPDAHIVTRAVGASPELALSCVHGELEAGDLFILASDGLTRLISADEIAAGLRGTDLGAAADQLIETCLERGAPDNVSIVLVQAASGSEAACA